MMARRSHYNNMDPKILEKITKYCVIQERCKYEVINKLKVYKVNIDDIDKYIIYPEQNNFLNEDRYTELFIRSKINQNQWGPIKIKFALYQKNIPAPLINKHFANYDENFFKQKIYDYLKKHQIVIEKLSYQEKIYWARHLLQKGYDSDMISEILF